MCSGKSTHSHNEYYYSRVIDTTQSALFSINDIQVTIGAQIGAAAVKKATYVQWRSNSTLWWDPKNFEPTAHGCLIFSRIVSIELNKDLH